MLSNLKFARQDETPYDANFKFGTLATNVGCEVPRDVEAGALMAYAVDLAEPLRRLAGGVHAILKGAKPGDIPIYQPNKLELLINLKTAKVLGLTLPPALLASAAEIIE